MAATIMKRAISLVSRQTSYEYRRHLSQIVNPNGTTRASTLAAVKSLETQGVPSNQAEAITSGVNNFRNDTLESEDGWEKIKELCEAGSTKMHPQEPSPEEIDQFKVYEAANAKCNKAIHDFKAELKKTEDEVFKWCVAVVVTGAVTGAIFRLTREN